MSLKGLTRIFVLTLLLLGSASAYSQTESFTFPDNLTDTITVSSDPYWWNIGDFAEGDRVLSGASAGGTLFLVIPGNSLSPTCSPGNWVDLELSINGSVVATHRVVQGEFSIEMPFVLADPISGTATIRIEEINEVCGGGGSIQVDSTGQSQIEFDVSAVPVPEAVPVPALSVGNLALMSTLIVLFGFYFGRRRIVK